ncbi:MAG: KH domain-containing protein [Gaiellales bacterium]
MTERSSQIGDYVQYVVEQLVDNSESVNVSEQVEGTELFVDIEVDQPDRGRVIGKNGRLIRSLRVVVRAAAGRDGSTAMVELIEDDDDAPAPAGDQKTASDDAPAAEA